MTKKHGHAIIGHREPATLRALGEEVRRLLPKTTRKLSPKGNMQRGPHKPVDTSSGD